MSDWWQHMVQAPATILTGIGGALLAVALEFRRHTWATALLAVVSGAFAAYIATEPIVTALSLPPSAGNAVAGVLGISGRNLIVWGLAASADPIKAWREFWGKK